MNTHNMKKQSTQNHKRSLHSQSFPGIAAGKSTGKEIKGSTARKKKTPGRRQRQQQIVLRAMLVTLASIFLILTAAILCGLSTAAAGRRHRRGWQGYRKERFQGQSWMYGC